MEKEKLEVGDNIYTIRGYTCSEIFSISKIERVTETLAFTDKLKFKREIGHNGYLYVTPKMNGHGTISYRLESDKLKQDHELQLLRNFAKSINVDKLSVEQLKKIKQIVLES